MRTIKFRAYHKKERKMYEVERIAFDEKTVRLKGKKIGEAWVDLEEVELVEFTGLEDKNGKEIFEGDIVGYWGRAVWPVIWDDEAASWRFGIGITRFKLSTSSIRSRKVIGNIYDNKELLE